MLWFAVPAGVAACAHYAIVNIDSIFLGRLSVQEMAAASIAFNITDFLTKLYSPSAYSLTALVAQAVGAGNPTLAGNWLQLVLGLVLAITVPSAVAYYFGTRWVASTFFSADDQVARLAQQFNGIYCIATVMMGVLMVLKQFASGLQHTTGPMIATLCTVILNVIFNQVFVFGIPGYCAGLGFVGSPLASTCAITAQLLIMTGFTFGYKRLHLEKHTWDGWEKESFRADRVCRFAQLAVKLSCGAMLEKSGTTGLIALVAILGPHALAAETIVFRLRDLCCSVFSGFFGALQVHALLCS